MQMMGAVGAVCCAVPTLPFDNRGAADIEVFSCFLQGHLTLAGFDFFPYLRGGSGFTVGLGRSCIKLRSTCRACCSLA